MAAAPSSHGRNSAAQSAIRDGRLLDSASAQDARGQLPEVLTVARAGVPGAEFNFWSASCAGTDSAPHRNKLHGEFERALARQTCGSLAKLGADRCPMSPEQFDAMMRETRDAWQVAARRGCEGNYSVIQ